MGLSRFLRTMKPDIKVMCAHPTRGHYIQGLKNMEEAIVPQIYTPSLIDVQEMIESEEAIEMARQRRWKRGHRRGLPRQSGEIPEHYDVRPVCRLISLTEDIGQRTDANHKPKQDTLY
jgi:hypothetical protein